MTEPATAAAVPSVNVAVVGLAVERHGFRSLLQSPYTQVRLLDHWPVRDVFDSDWADVVFVLSVPGSVNRTYLGEHALLACVHDGQLVVDVGRIGATVLGEVVAEAQRRRVRFVDLRRVAADLTCWGGPADAWWDRTHLLDALGGTVVHCGVAGSAAVVADVVSHVTLVSCAGSQEGLVLGAKAGVSLQALTRVIERSSGASSSLTSSVPRCAVGAATVTPRSARDASEDLSHVLRLAGTLSVPVPLASITLAMVHGTSHRGAAGDVATDLRALGAAIAGVELSERPTVGNWSLPGRHPVTPRGEVRLPTVGFIGVGRIGKPMASRLLQAGCEMVVYNRSQGSVEHLVMLGARARANPREVAESCDVVVTCLPDDDALGAVYWGPDGLLSGIRSGQELLDTGTTSVATTLRVGGAVADRGAVFVDAPVSGGLEKAACGALTLMIGAPDGTLTTGRAVLDALGEDVFYLGMLGAGQVTKLVNNLLNATNFAATCEGLVLAAAAGVDVETMLRVLNHPGVGSYASAFRGPRIMRRDFAATYTTRLRVKDSRVALDLGHEISAPLLLGSVVHQLFEAAVALGWGEEDWTSLVKVYEEFADLHLSDHGGTRFRVDRRDPS